MSVVRPASHLRAQDLSEEIGDPHRQDSPARFDEQGQHLGSCMEFPERVAFAKDFLIGWHEIGVMRSNTERPSSWGSLTILPPDDVIFGHTEDMRNIREKLEKAAAADVPVLVQGASGTGKEVVAKSVHELSRRRTGPFVKVHCPGIPAALLESELFGYEEGAFSGAAHAKPGRAEAAHGGTLFLDEIAEMDSGLQVKLIHFLQDGQFSRIGAQKPRAVEVRVVCTTSRSLEQEITAGRFRQDLFYRINVVRVHLPPLRDRKGDIPDLVDYFLSFYNEKYKRAVEPLSAHCLQLLLAHDWPGNIRELENLINRYVILGSEEAITSELLGANPGSHNAQDPSHKSVSLRRIAQQAALEAQRKVILRVLQANHWNRKRAAQALKISYRALLYKIKDAGIPPKRAMESRDTSNYGSVN